MNDNENKTNAPIKLPVRYDGEYIRDADNQPIGLADAVEIVAALNEAEALRAEVERLKDALRGIRDMPEYDQDDVHRLRNQAGVALGKADIEDAAIKPNVAAGEEGTQ